jgi:hypothetical protein
MEKLSQHELEIGLLLFGVLLAYLGLLLVNEYRKAFLENPPAVMSLEVLFQLLRIGGPGYLAMLLLVCSVFFMAAGLGMLVAPWVSHLWAGAQ